MNTHADVIIVGAGPAGIATAIAASMKGLRSVVVEAQSPPIDKSCGEGLLPQGAVALRALGIHLASDVAVPFRGIRFADEHSSACAKFSDGVGFGLRRIRLNQLLLDRASRMGVTFLWNTRISSIEENCVIAGGNRIRYDWLVGADGQNSGIRKWVNPDSQLRVRVRFAFRRHFRIRPWTDVVETYWGKRVQMLMTPTGPEEVCVIVLSRDSQLRIDRALQLFPALAKRLQNAIPVTREMGNVTGLTRLPTVTRGRIALVGDASGTVDAITGYGLSLSFHQALKLAEALEQGNLSRYKAAHRKINAMPAMMSRLMMFMDRSDWIRRKILRLSQNHPGLFSKLLSIHAGELSLSSIRTGELVEFASKLW